ncbi:hypothetical protein FBQ81_07245 [Chloroflexi bacterium CFX6]|nr:hypothetical protein [Chloroflexi bacterium CFX6]
METSSKFIVPGILFLLTLVFDFWLSRLGKPYNALVFNVHKLIALGAVIFAVLQAYNLLKGAGVQSVVVALVAVCIVCVISLFTTGAFMSIGNLPHAPLLTIHKIALTVLPLAAVSTIYFLIGKPQ